MSVNAYSGTVMATKDEQPTKKLALRQLPNNNKNTILTSPGNSPFHKDKTLVSDAMKVSSNCVNGHHLVYARRKLETEPANINNKSFDSQKLETESVSNNHSCSPPLKRFRNDYTSASPLKVSANVPALNHLRDQYWKERYDRLQLYLKACDESKREEYIWRLTSLSSAGLSRHAIELEKRAIHLALEEKKEMVRGRALNVLRKSMPKHHSRDQQYKPMDARSVEEFMKISNPAI